MGVNLVPIVRLDFIFSLYKNYIDDLKRVKEYQRKLYSQKGYSHFERYFIYRALKYIIEKFGLQVRNKIRMNPQLDDIKQK